MFLQKDPYKTLLDLRQKKRRVLGFSDRFLHEGITFIFL
ncbi:hypothetical protein LEP1GSC170_5538 [Leptospira interrogans serovar Bataviae str. HAI135]|nr:hypothetical protein LEP1GSC170_5538 [Leptospira interrogans serovar Bataviae str. HAI135]